MDRDEGTELRLPRREVGGLIETAARLDGLASEDLDDEIGWAELRQVAKELGITDEALLRAVALRLEEGKRARRRRRAWLGWRTHVASYLAVISGLFLLDLVTAPGLSWYVYPAIGWGIGVLVHTLTLVVTGGAERQHP